MAIFGPKQCLNPPQKISIFRLLKLHVFIAQNRLFLVLEYRKRHFPGLYCLKKKLLKRPFLDQNHGLTPLKYCQFFDNLNFLFLLPRQAFFRSRISQKTFSWPILQKKKTCRKMTIIGPKPWVKSLEKCQFFDYLNFLL